MATILLKGIGTAIGGPVGGFIGGAIGAYIDSRYVMPAIFGEDPIEGPRIDDFKIQTASEGSPIRRCFGPRNPMSGTLIWSSTRREETRSTGGGKGGTGSDPESSFPVYFQDLAIAVCEGEISDIKKVWADGKLVYDVPDPVSESSQLVKVRKYNGGSYKTSILQANTALGQIDFKDAGYVAGQDVTISGFVGLLTPNNGTFPIKRIKTVSVVQEIQTLTFSGPTSSGSFKLSFRGEVTTYLAWDATAADVEEALDALFLSTDDNDFTVAGTLPTGMTVTFKSQYSGDDVPLIVLAENNLNIGSISIVESTKGSRIAELFVYNDNAVSDSGPITETITVEQVPTGFSVGKVDDVRIYLGTAVQAADTLIEANMGQAPAFRGLAYIVLENLKLKPFGNRIPQFKFLVEEAESRNVGEAIGSIIESTQQLTSADYDVSGITDPLIGYTMSGPQTPVSMIEPIMVAHDIAARKSNGVLTFYKRGTETTIIVAEGDLAARQGGRDVPPQIELSDIADFELATEVNVKFIEDDADSHYQQASQREQSPIWERKVVKEINLPLVMSSGPARDIAARVLYEQRAMRQTVKLSLPPSYLQIEEGDILSVPYDGETYLVRVAKVSRGDNFVHEIEGTIEDRPLLDWESEGEAYGGGGGSELYTPPDTSLMVLDIPSLQESDATLYGYYAGIAASDILANWEGASLFRDAVGGSDFEGIAAMPNESTMGEANTVLASGSVSHWDMESTVEVELFQGTLASDTLINVINGANRLMVGDEMIGFANATLTADNTYTLDTLIRGLRNTPVSGHVVDEQVIGIDNHLIFVEVSSGHRSNSFDFKGVPSEGDADLWPVNAQLAPFEANTMKCFPVTNIHSVTDGTDWDATWTRRSRAPVSDLQEGGDVPLLPSVEEYEIDVLSGVGGAVVNTYLVIVPAWTYTGAEQTADFGSEQSSINYIIYQLDSGGIGRGYSSEEQNT